MKPHSRLLDDPNLAAHLRDDLSTLVQNPHQVDLDRAARALAVAIGGSLVASSAPAAANAAKTGSSLPIAIKGALAALGSATVVGVALVTLQPAAPPAVPHHVPAAEPKPAAPAARLPAPSQPEAPPLEESAPVPPAEARLPSASRREIAQLQRIQRLLPERPLAAYRLAQLSAREFPNGALREEREGLAVLALLRLGDRARAERGAQRFLAQYPQSPLAQRIRSLLGEP